MLGGFGCTAYCRTEYQAVLTELTERAYDLVFIDCEMPDMDAAFLAREIRKHGARCRRQPYIIAVTADISAMHYARCLRAGINDFLAKPVRPEILEAGLRRWSSLAAKFAAPSARPKSPSAPAIDPQALSRLHERAGSRSDKFVRGYIDLFLQDTVERLEVLRAALERRDHHLLGREIHALKGACLEFGVSRMGVYCDELRDASRDGRVDELPDALLRIKSEFEKVRPVFEDARNRSG
jgi:CheY-like chemotaxis protein